MNFFRVAVVLLALGCALAFPLASSGILAAEGMEWSFTEVNDPDNKERLSARLSYGVPETDNVQVAGVCEGAPDTGAAFSSVTFGADNGDLKDGAETELRFSGGGFDHSMKGAILRPGSGEGISGVRLDIQHDDPLWQALQEKDTLDYLVPGYRANSLELTRGRDKIKSFIEACRVYAKAPGDDMSASSTATPEKEAFESAKELGMAEAWQAFLSNYPSGFHADLARAYLKKLSGSSASAPKPQAKKKCKRGYQLVDDTCIKKQDAATHCGPGYRLQGGKCVQGYQPPKPQLQRPAWQIEAIQKGCKPGMGWNPQEGCHEND